jgi:hypothetical protein
MHFLGRRIVRVLAAALLSPALLPLAATHAYAGYYSCYASSVRSDYVTAYPASGVTYTSFVQYQIGYDCSGYPMQVYVNYFHDTLSVSGSASYAWHQSISASQMKYYDPSYPPAVWTDYTTYGCGASCTVSRVGWPHVWAPYYYSANLYDAFAGCDWIGHGHCDFWHEFIAHRLPYTSG